MPSRYRKNTTRRTVNGFWRRLFNDTVYMEFRVCFTIAKHENGMFSLCGTSNALIDALCYSNIHFHQIGPFKLIKTMWKSLHVLLGLSSVWNRYPKGSHTKGTTKRSIIALIKLKIEFAKNKCLSTIWSTETIPIA